MTHTQMMVENIPVCGSTFPADQNMGTNSSRKTESFRFSDEGSNFNRQLVFIVNIGTNNGTGLGTFPTDSLKVGIEISPDGEDDSYIIDGGSTPEWTEKCVDIPPDSENKTVCINVNPSELNALYPSTAYPKAKIRAFINCRSKDNGGNLPNIGVGGKYFNSMLVMGETLRYGLAGSTNDALESQMSEDGFSKPIGSGTDESELFLKAY